MGEWTSTNSTRLKKINSSFEFELKVFEMLTIFDTNFKTFEEFTNESGEGDYDCKITNMNSAFLLALEYAKKHLKIPNNPEINSKCHQMLQNALGKIVLGVKSYDENFSFTSLQSKFQTEFSKLLESNKTGLATMKTAHCVDKLEFKKRVSIFHNAQVGHIH